ncbi:MAG TPA: pectate lyase-like adhesive domain-containing protein [Candidatus Paceibacterota bacterium]|nr:pectate lyase-like adhesive domain-containing protein [Candidatus Paceibacterota bacterium]
MKKYVNRLSVALVAFGTAISLMPIAALAANYNIVAPSSVTITESSLIAHTNGVADSSSDVAAVASSENSIEMTLQGDGIGAGLPHVRIAPTAVTGGSGTVQLWIHEAASDKWYDTAIIGWGPTEGFPITADYNGSVTVVAIADAPGTYALNYSVVDVDNSSAVVASGQTTLTVEEQTAAYVSSEAELNAALADETITDITLDSDFVIGATIDVSRPVTIDGAGHTVSVNDSITGTALLITGDSVTVTDLTVDAAGKVAKGSAGIQGIQVYVAEDVVLRNVTSMNAGKSGLMVNGATVTVENVTTSGNTWHGINVDQGSGVTTPAILTVTGTSSHLESGPAIYIDDSESGSVTGSLEQYTRVDSAPAVAYFQSTVDSEEELSSALLNSAIGTITIGGDITTSEAVAINRSVTIEGNGRTITGDFVKTSSGNNSVVLITASDVTINSLTVDGVTTSNNLHGINTYVVTGITLANIETNNVNTGVNVNGSIVTVTDITTSNSAWHAINVDQGSGVTTDASLTVNGTSAHAEADGIHHIWVDDIALANVTVLDTNSQYESTEVVWDDNGTPRTGRSYTLQEAESNGGGGGGSRRNNNDDESDDEVADEAGEVTDAGEGEVLGAATYNFAADLTIGATGQDVTELQTILIASGYLKIAAPTGYFGPLTQEAVKLYQAANGIPATGYVGPLTRAALNASTMPTSTSDAATLTTMIAQLQQMLLILQSLK